MSPAGRAAAAGGVLLSAGGCVVLQFPIQVLSMILNGVFRLGEAAINAVGAGARALGPYLLFWAANDPASAPGPREVEALIANAARARPLVEEGIERALEQGPSAAGLPLIVPLEEVLEEDGLPRICDRLRGRRLLSVTFARLPEVGVRVEDLRSGSGPVASGRGGR